MSQPKIPQQVIGLALVFFFLAGCGAPAATPLSPTNTPAPPTATLTPEPPTATLTPALPTTTPTPLPPTITPTPEPPTATPTPDYIVVTSAEEIIGTWVKDTFYIRFDDDGTFRQAHSAEDLENHPYTINSYRFDGDRMITAELSIFGVPSCGNRDGRYEIGLLENGNIRIVAIRDACAPRRGDTEGEYEPVH